MKAVILGGCLSGIQKALKLRQQGWTVVLCVESTCVAEEWTATWAGYSSCRQAMLGDALRMTGIDMEPPFLPGKVKRESLRRLMDAGVDVRFMTRVAGLLKDHGRICGVVLAQKGGLHREQCDLLLDASLYHTASARLQNRSVLIPQNGKVSFFLEYRGVPLKAPLRLSETEMLEPGPLAEDQAYLCVSWSVEKATPLGQAREAMWHRAIAAAKHLAQDGRFPQLEMTNALPDQIAIDLPGMDEVLSISEGHAFDETWRSYPERESEVMVCGAGTAGIRAALAAAERKQVLLVENFAYPGGTRTMGGVQWLYYGNRSPLFQQMFAEIDAYAKALSHRQAYSRFGAAEALLYLEKCWCSGIDYRPDTLVCGARVKQGKIERLLCVGADGVYTVCPHMVLDASGDGDIAALCGTPMQHGDDATGMMQNYSQAHRVSGTVYDAPVADQGTMRSDLSEEWHRAIAQNTLQCADYDCVPMLTVRESSRIVGKYQITLQDVARGHVETDALIDAYSSYDPHMRCMSLPGRLGLMPERGKPRFVSVPYRALCTHEADNLLVIGKAFSATQDAFNYCRMCADVMALGHAAGRIAAISRDLSCADLAPVQQEMLAGGALVRRPGAIPYDENTPERVVAPLLCGVEGSLAEVVLCNWPQVHGMLLAALDNGVIPDCRRVAGALLWYEDRRCAEAVLTDLQRFDEEAAAMPYQDRDREGLISGGIREETDLYWRMNQSMVLLARAQERRAIPELCRAMNRTRMGGFYHPGKRTYGSQRPDCLTNDFYDRMLCLAEVGLLMPDEAFGAPLMRLARMAQEIPSEDRNVYMDYLALRLAHAAFVCGSCEAETILAQYAVSIHGVLRSYARSILQKQAVIS